MSKTYHQANLFAQLPAPTEAGVREWLRPMYPLLRAAIMEPWDEFVEYRRTDPNFRDLSEDEVAQWLTIQACRRARKLFAGEDTIELLTVHNKLVILLVDKLAITIKKLTKRSWSKQKQEVLTRSSFRTPRNRAFYLQAKNMDVPDVPRVVFGYQLLKEISEIKLWIAYPRSLGRAFEWAYVLPAEVVAPRLAVQPLSPADENPQRGFVITAAEEAKEIDKE